jgi:hypothetical protein
MAGFRRRRRLEQQIVKIRLSAARCASILRRLNPMMWISPQRGGGGQAGACAIKEPDRQLISSCTAGKTVYGPIVP